MTTIDDQDGSNEYENETAGYWRESGKKGLVFAKPDDFIPDSTIEDAITISYKKFIESANPALFPQNQKGYYETGWQAIDKDNKYMYKATWDPQYHYGIMRVHAPKPKAAEVNKAINDKVDYISNHIDEILKILNAAKQTGKL
jgi:hypothetical protein